MKNMKVLAFISSLAGVAVIGTGCGSNVSQTNATDTKVIQETSSEETSSEETPSEEVSSDVAGADAKDGEVQKVTVAHTQTYIPYDYVNEAGESDGFEVQVLKAVDELLPQYEFSYVPTTDDDLLIGVESGKYNIGTKGAWFTEERAEKFIFPKNYIGASSIGITYRTENADKIKNLESFAAFSGKLVPIAPQNAQYNVVEQYNAEHPDNQVDLQASDAFTIADAYSWVVEGRYDAFFDIKTSFENNVVAEEGAYHDYADKLSYAVYQAIPTYPLFNKENQELADAYDEAIKQLTDSGKILELEKDYFGEDLFQYIQK